VQQFFSEDNLVGVFLPSDDRHRFRHFLAQLQHAFKLRKENFVDLPIQQSLLLQRSLHPLEGSLKFLAEGEFCGEPLLEDEAAVTGLLDPAFEFAD
jgi:hypothetical protein